MRVIVNYLAAAGAKTGVGHYTAEVLRCMRRQAGEDAIDTFPGPLGLRLHGALKKLRRESGRAPTAPPVGAPPARPSWRGRALHAVLEGGRAARAAYFRRLCRRRRYDVYHEPNFLPFPCDCPTVITVHDLSVLLHPEWHPRERVARFEQHFRRGLAQCTHVLTVSDFVRQEVIQELGIHPGRVTRAYNGVRAGLAPLPAEEVREGLRRLGLPSGYFLCLGTIEPRKNVLTLLRAYCDLPARVRSAHPLVLVGGWGWGAAEVADYLHGEARHRGVRHLGYADDADLAVLYNGAHALAYPSLYEGFGLPPAEMLACGGAVLASTAGAVAETVGTQAHLVEPLDVAGWRAALLRCADDRDWWLTLRRGAPASVARFSWQQCAADTLRVFRAIANPEPARRAA